MGKQPTRKKQRQKGINALETDLKEVAEYIKRLRINDVFIYRVPFRKIAQEIGVTPDTIIRKYRNLEENGMIRCLIQIDLAKMGYSVVLSNYD